MTGLQIVYSGALDLDSALNAASYQLLLGKKTRKLGTQFTAPVALVSQSHNANASMVVFTPKGKLKQATYELKITSSASGGVHDLSGQPLIGGSFTLMLKG